MKYSVLNPGIFAVVPKVLELFLCVEHNSQLFLPLSKKYNNYPLGFNKLRLFKLGSAPGERWWPRAARGTRRDCRTPPTKPTSHWRPSRLTGPQLEAGPLVLDSLFWSENNDRTFFGWISNLMKPKGCVNQRQTHKLHLLWDEITGPRLILKCESEQ